MFNKAWEIAKGLPWWAWAAGAVVILIVINQVSGSIYSRKLWNVVADQIRDDQSRVVRTLEENQRMYEAEITRLLSEAEGIRKEQESARAETERLKGVIREKDGEILALRAERDSIVVPSDPGAVVDELRRLGYGTARRK